MSERYEGVVFCTGEQAARDAFTHLGSDLRLRLVHLAPGVFGIHRVAGRAAAFNQPAVERIAEQISTGAGRAVALFYDNGCDVRGGVLYSGGCRGREFGDEDAWWVPYREDGELMVDGPRFRQRELRPALEYDCIFDAIDAALEAVQAGPWVSAALVKQAFCYGESELLAETGTPLPDPAP
jgi:hypothetical protein